jgi:hypothetical protein
MGFHRPIPLRIWDACNQAGGQVFGLAPVANTVGMVQTKIVKGRTVVIRSLLGRDFEYGAVLVLFVEPLFCNSEEVASRVSDQP